MSDLIERQDALDALEKIGWIETKADKEYAIQLFTDLPSAQPDQYIKEKSVDIGHLYDWYQNSVTDDPPVWTDEHIKEMFCDFYMIPRQEKEREEIMNEFDRTSGGD